MNLAPNCMGVFHDADVERQFRRDAAVATRSEAAFVVFCMVEQAVGLLLSQAFQQGHGVSAALCLGLLSLVLALNFLSLRHRHQWRYNQLQFLQPHDSSSQGWSDAHSPAVAVCRFEGVVFRVHDVAALVALAIIALQPSALLLRWCSGGNLPAPTVSSAAAFNSVLLPVLAMFVYAAALAKVHTVSWLFNGAVTAVVFASQARLLMATASPLPEAVGAVIRLCLLQVFAAAAASMVAYQRWHGLRVHFGAALAQEALRARDADLSESLSHAREEATKTQTAAAVHELVGSYFAHQIMNPVSQLSLALGELAEMRATGLPSSGSEGFPPDEALALERTVDPLVEAQAALQQILRVRDDMLLQQLLLEGRLELHAAATDIRALVRGVVSETKSNGGHISAECAQGVPRMVMCDPLRLRQLLFHLAAVAWQPSESSTRAPRPHAPRLQVQLADRSCSSSPLSAGAQVLEVVVERDDVHATEAEDLCALLQHGAQDPRALSSWHQQLASIGLALPIASGLVRAMGGCIRVQSLPSPAGRVRLVARLPMRMAPLRSRGDSCPLLSSPLRPSSLASPATFKPNLGAGRPSAAVAMRKPEAARLEAAQTGGIGTTTLHDSPAARSAGSLTTTDTASHQLSPSGFSGDQAWADEGDEGRRSDASVPILRLRSSMAPITPATPRKDNRDAPQRPLPRHLLGGRKVAASDGIAPRNLEEPLTPRSNPTARLHVCIVDDDAMNRRLHERLVKKLGHSVTLCTDGDEVAPAVAQAAASGTPVAGVLLDIMMPRMGGVEACKALRTAGYAGCIIAVTANASPADQERYAHAGFDAVLPKPFTTAQLSRVLTTMLSGCPGAVVPPRGTGSVALAAESVQLVLPPLPPVCVMPAIPVTTAV